MTNAMRRILAMLLVLVLGVALFPIFKIDASAASTSSDFSYVYDSTGRYIYNWGTREEKATFLSPNAEKFYQKNNTSYEELSSFGISRRISSSLIGRIE